jgi:hypothetical protein
MAKFITIPNTVAGAQPSFFNVDNILAVSYLTATTFAIYCGPRSFTFTTSAAGASSTVSVIQKAILSIAGPSLVEIVMPAGVTIAALPVVVIT